MTTWDLGDYPSMAQRLEPVADAAVRAASVGPGDRVLDVATGTGNAALIAAAAGAHVVGVDFEPALLRVAGRRAREAGHVISWRVGDLVALPSPDASVDVVMSVFGVMYAADHAAAARELARVAAPGARLALASWAPGSAMPAMGQVLSGYLPPPPPSTGPPTRWGDADAVAALLESCGLRVLDTTPGAIMLRFADPSAGAEFLIRTAGHVISEQQRLTQEGRWNALHRDLTAFVAGRAERAGDHLELTLDYLLVLAIKPEQGAA